MMRVKIRGGNDYTKLQDTPVDPGEARRALRHFIERSEQGREIPEDLMAFILAGLRRQLDSDEGGWFLAEKKVPDLYLPAKAWYCLNFGKSFKRGSHGLATCKEQYAAIGMHLKQQSSALFEQLSVNYPGTDRSAYRDNYSENYIGKMIKEFQRSGFMQPGETLSAEDARVFNISAAKLFCEFELGMEGEKANIHAIEILECWSRGHVKGEK